MPKTDTYARPEPPERSCGRRPQGDPPALCHVPSRPRSACAPRAACGGVGSTPMTVRPPRSENHALRVAGDDLIGDLVSFPRTPGTAARAPAGSWTPNSGIPRSAPAPSSARCASLPRRFDYDPAACQLVRGQGCCCVCHCPPGAGKGPCGPRCGHRAGVLRGDARQFSLRWALTLRDLHSI